MYAYAENEYRVTNEQEFIELLESGRAPAASEKVSAKQDALVPPTEMLRIAVDGLKPVLR
jgi:hypothetical protein